MHDKPEYIEGRQSYHKNKGKLTCSYPNPSTEYDLFARGWVQAQKSSSMTYESKLEDGLERLRPESYQSSSQSLKARLILDSKYNAYANRK